MSDTSSIPDRLATLLVELRGRLGAEGFTNRRRVVSLAADRIPEAGREIKILGTAIDDGVLDMLEAARGGRIDLEIDRLAAAFEARHGIRSDIARPVVQALAHALGLAALPSAGTLPVPAALPGQDDWVGATSILPTHAAPPHYAAASVPTQQTVPVMPAPAAARATPVQIGLRWMWRGLGAFGAVVGVLLVIGLMVEQPNQSGEQPQQPPERVVQTEPQRVVQAEPPQRQQPVDQADPPPRQLQPRAAQADDDDEAPLPLKPGAEAPSRPQQQPAQPPPPQQAAPQLPPGYDVAALQALAVRERQDYGVPPTSTLHQGAAHAPTPTSIPGGKLIDTMTLIAMLNQQPAAPVAIVDALGGPTKLPNAYTAPVLARSGNYNDQIQQQMRQQFQSLNRDLPIVTYCADPNCWMSYNAALRFINLGFRNVLWYRGGLWAWQQAGMQTEAQQPQQ